MTTKMRLYSVYIMSFMDLFAVGLVFPLLYSHMRSLGASHFTVGIVGSMYSILQVLSGPIIGRWSDIRGRRFVLLITLSVCTVCYVLLGLTTSLAGLFVIRGILGIFKHTQSICKAIIADTLPREQQVSAYGHTAGLGMLGFVVGPTIGGHIAEYSNGFLLVCYLTSMLFFINVVLTFYVHTGTVRNREKGRAPTLLPRVCSELARSLKDLKKINWKVHWETFSVRFLFGLTVSLYFANQSAHLKEKYELSQRHVGYTISFLSVIGVVSSFSLGAITRKFYSEDTDCQRRMTHSFLILAMCFLGFYMTSNIYFYLSFLIPFAISTAILRIVSLEFMLSKSQEDERGLISGTCNSVMSVARSLTPFMSGVISEFVGENAVMIFGFLPALTGTMLCVKLNRKYKQQ